MGCAINTPSIVNSCPSPPAAEVEAISARALTHCLCIGENDCTHEGMQGIEHRDTYHTSRHVCDATRPEPHSPLVHSSCNHVLTCASYIYFIEGKRHTCSAACSSRANDNTCDAYNTTHNNAHNNALNLTLIDLQLNRAMQCLQARQRNQSPSS